MAQLTALVNVMTFCVNFFIIMRNFLYIIILVMFIHVLPHNFPDMFHALPCYQGQECTVLHIGAVETERNPLKPLLS